MDRPLDALLARDVAMSARDGQGLATDVWRPAHGADPAPGTFPALLLRTPYDRRSDRYQRQGEFFASNGYIFVVQDCRGRFASGGDFVLLANEGPDGYDAVEWLAELPFCNGDVGTLGTSYSAWTQSACALERPPHLRAMWINQGGSNGCRTALRHNGALELRWLTWAITHGAASVAASEPVLANTLRESALQMFEWLRCLPWGDKSPLSDLPGYERWARDLYEHADEVDDDEYWNQKGLNFEPHYGNTADVPTMHSGGWYDSYTRATTDNFVSLAGHLLEQHLLIGPWIHGDASLDRSVAGEVDFGQSASMASNPEMFKARGRMGEQLRWFDRWLRPDRVGQDLDMEPVTIFVMGGGDGSRTAEGRLMHGGRWRTEPAWPLARAEPTEFYLQPDGGLGISEPPVDGGSSTFEHDPDRPLPTVSANTSSLNEVLPLPDRVAQSSPIDLMRVMVIQGGADQVVREDTLRVGDEIGPLHLRRDVIYFETDPLVGDLEVTGPIEVQAHLSSDAPDTDLFVMIQDVYPPTADWPEGFNLNISDSLMRVRYRNGFERGELLTPGEVVTVRFHLYPTSNLFAAGHRIRVLVAGSSFPRFDPNPNTGEAVGRHTEVRVATNTIHHSKAHRSRIVLPIVAATS